MRVKYLFWENGAGKVKVKLQSMNPKNCPNNHSSRAGPVILRPFGGCSLDVKYFKPSYFSGFCFYHVDS